jgi:uncharacterized SAM-binding protein YcdF (DUF218 family)
MAGTYTICSAAATRPRALLFARRWKSLQGPARRAAWAGALLLAAAAAVLLLHGPLLRGAASLAVVRDAASPADAILLLNGGLGSRPAAAAALHRQGLAPAIVIVRAEDRAPGLEGLYPNVTDVSVALLRRAGVAESAIVVLDGGRPATSTAEEAAAFAAYVREQRARRLLVVTSDYHTRRTRWLLRRAMRGQAVELRMHAAAERFSPADWWRTEEGLLAYTEEALKFVHGALIAR